MDDTPWYHDHGTVVFLMSIVILIICIYEKLKSLRYLNLTILKELMLLKLRLFIIDKLETGKLIKYREPYSDLIYYDGVEKYIIRYSKRRGSYPFTKVISDSGLDVTELIKMYAGPSGNFHGISVTPLFLGYQMLAFDTNNGVKYFIGEQVIEL